MSSTAVLETEMRLNSTAFRAGMTQAAATANRTLGSIQKQAAATASTLLQLKRAANAAGSLYLLKQGFDGLVDAQKQLQAIHYTFQAATGSATQAADAFAFVTKEAGNLGLVLPDSAEGFAKLSASATAAGVSMKDQQQLFDAYAKSSVTLHLSTTQSSRALLALEQMFAKGKIQAQELRLQLGQAIPGAAQRFQNAVMQMTKGTDLAGKSFDQLLEAGDLTTSKFLPALVTALQASGRGWEDASHGLQAELNRVQTAWFNLKTEASGGLFGDAVTVGARTLANNLASVASGLTAIAGVAAARSLGGLLNTGTSKVARYEQEYRGARMAASAEAEYAASQVAAAEATAAQAMAERNALKDRAASLAASRAATQQAKQEAVAKFEQAAADKAAADLTLRYAGNDPARWTIKGQSAAAAASAAAQRRLALATATYNSTLAASNALKAEANVQNSALIKSDIALAAAEDAVAVAQARVAETRAAEAALGGLGAAAGRAAKSLGGFAMSLVGGPWGLAVAAIASVGYAVYSLQKQGEEWRAETENEVKSLQQVTDAAKAAAEGFNTYWDARNHTAGVDSFVETATAVSKVRSEVADLQHQADALRKAIELRSTGASGGTAIADWFDQRKLEQVNARIVELSANLPAAASAANELGNKVSYGLLPAVDALKGGLDRLRAGASLKGIWDGLTEGFAAGNKALDDAKAKVAQLQQEMEAVATRNEKDLKTRGKSQAQIQQQNLKDIEANIKAQSNLTKAQQDAQIAAARAAAAPQIKLAAQDDAARNAKKTAGTITAEAEAYKTLTAQISSRLEQDKAAAASTNTLTEAQRLQIKVQEEFRVGKTKLTAADRDHVKQMLAAAVAQSLVTRATLQQRDADKALLDLDRQLSEQAQQQARTNSRMLEGIGHGSQWNEQRAGIESIQDAYRKQREQADKAYEAAKLQQGASVILDNQHAAALGKITAAEQEAIAGQEKFYADQKALNADWGQGFQAGIEDFMTQQQNNAAQAKQMVADLTTGFSDAFVQFASGAESAKDAFGSFIDDMYKKALAFVANKAIQAFFDSFGLSGSAATPGSSAGGWASLAGNLLGSMSSSGGGGGFGPGTIGAGLANGGPAAPGSAHPVVEKGPEILQVGGRTYLMMGAEGGRVTPLSEARGGGGGNTYVTNVNVQPTSTRRTADQVADATARIQRIAATRNS